MADPIRRLIVSVAWRCASLRPPWRAEPWTLPEHFGITALTALGLVLPYLWGR